MVFTVVKRDAEEYSPKEEYSALKLDPNLCNS